MPRSSTTLADYAASGLKNKSRQAKRGRPKRGHALQQTSLNDTKGCYKVALTSNLAGCAASVLSNRPGRLCSFRAGKAGKTKKGENPKRICTATNFLQRYRQRYHRTGCGKLFDSGPGCRGCPYLTYNGRALKGAMRMWMLTSSSSSSVASWGKLTTKNLSSWEHSLRPLNLA